MKHFSPFALRDVSFEITDIQHLKLFVVAKQRNWWTTVDILGSHSDTFCCTFPQSLLFEFYEVVGKLSNIKHTCRNISPSSSVWSYVVRSRFLNCESWCIPSSLSLCITTATNIPKKIMRMEVQSYSFMVICDFASSTTQGSALSFLKIRCQTTAMNTAILERDSQGEING